MWYHWMPMLYRSIGRVTVAFWLFLILAFSLVSLWLYVIEPILPGVIEYASVGLAYATEQLGWLWSWLVAQF